MMQGVKQPCEAFTNCEADLRFSFKIGVKCEACEADSSKDRYISKLLILHKRPVIASVKNRVYFNVCVPASHASHPAKIWQPLGESRLWRRLSLSLPSEQGETKNARAAVFGLNICDILINPFIETLNYDNFTGKERARMQEQTQMEDIEPAGTARKLIGRKVEWRLHFEDKRYQARPNRAESQERRCDYFDVYATQDDGREVGYLTRKVGRDGIEWRGKIDGHHVQLYRNPEHCAAEDREVFDIYHAAHCQGWRNNCEGHEHDEEVDAPKEEAA